MRSPVSFFGDLLFTLKLITISVVYCQSSLNDIFSRLQAITREASIIAREHERLIRKKRSDNAKFRAFTSALLLIDTCDVICGLPRRLILMSNSGMTAVSKSKRVPEDD